jgi:hypothetical protein
MPVTLREQQIRQRDALPRRPEAGVTDTPLDVPHLVQGLRLHLHRFSSIGPGPLQKQGLNPEYHQIDIFWVVRAINSDACAAMAAH